jgi:hypothetical protein
MYISAMLFSREPGIDATVAAKFSRVSIDDIQTQLRSCVRKETSMVSSVILLKQRMKLKYCIYKMYPFSVLQCIKQLFLPAASLAVKHLSCAIAQAVRHWPFTVYGQVCS